MKIFFYGIFLLSIFIIVSCRQNNYMCKDKCEDSFVCKIIDGRGICVCDDDFYYNGYSCVLYSDNQCKDGNDCSVGYVCSDGYCKTTDNRYLCDNDEGRNKCILMNGVCKNGKCIIPFVVTCRIGMCSDNKNSHCIILNEHISCVCNDGYIIDNSGGCGNCKSDIECKEGNICDPDTKLCVDSCDRNSDCSIGNICKNGLCIEGCQSYRDCDEGQYCDLNTWKCKSDEK